MSGLTLGIDTSTVVCAGLADGDRVLASEVVDDSRAHAEALMPLVRRVLAQAGAEMGDLRAIAVGVGPGPFTGLRVGVAAATVLAEVLGVPVRGVCSLDVIAAAVLDGRLTQRHAAQGRSIHTRHDGSSDSAQDDLNPLAQDADLSTGFLVVTDARRGELYWARYDALGLRTDGPSVGKPETLPKLPTCGPGTGVREVPGPVLPGVEVLDAGLLARSAWTLPDAGLAPLYLRRPDADAPSVRKSALPGPRLSFRDPTGGPR